MSWHNFFSDRSLWTSRSPARRDRIRSSSLDFEIGDRTCQFSKTPNLQHPDIPRYPFVCIIYRLFIEAPTTHISRHHGDHPPNTQAVCAEGAVASSRPSRRTRKAHYRRGLRSGIRTWIQEEETLRACRCH